MLKYFCDRCGTEMSSYDYDNAAQVTITDKYDADSLKIYTVCSNCEFAIKHFMKDGQYKAGEHNDM